ncbi:MAG: DUF2330 domain-containing protein [Deltaproteobacteria bacterium]|nr:DUF2330 domain-containing protein [Deltaproteobacteria bacterium]
MRARDWVVRGVLISLAAASFGSPEVARACGGFFMRSQMHKPSLAHEQVLLIHDADKSLEHFIRAVSFREATEPFGFVVPTPSRPDVEKVTESPFIHLGHEFRFDPPPKEEPRSEGFGAGHGRLGGAAQVQVLETKAVGSFTAFVLAATDPSALTDWLTKNELTQTPESGAWLEHYVRLGFYFVALRYEPKPARADAGPPPAERPVKAETIRISFSTPFPFYPYLEPAPAAGAPVGGGDRVLDLWFAGARDVVPVALAERRGTPPGQAGWIRPLREGQRFDTAAEGLTAVLPKELAPLVPAGVRVVQTFQDQKHARVGLGDILFVPRKETPLTPEQQKMAAPLLALLDTALLPEKQ